MNNELKITKGKWMVDSFQVSTGFNPTDETICELKIHSEYPSVFERSREEAKANAQLIAEAGNVANETGMTPKQMQQRIQNLEQALESVLRTENGDGEFKFIKHAKIHYEIIDVLHQNVFSDNN